MKGGCKASPRGLDDILISPRLKESIIASGALLFSQLATSQRSRNTYVHGHVGL